MRIRSFLLLLSIVSFIQQVQASDYEEAWKAIHRNDRSSALQYLQKAFADPSDGVDAYITYMYLCSFEGKDSKVTEFIPNVYQKLSMPDPYVYALWFQRGVLGNYGKKTSTQQKLLDKLLTDGKCNGSLRSAANYVQFWAHLAGNEWKKSNEAAAKMGAAGPLWQLAGPFDNISGSGFNKAYGPLQHPEPGALFKSADNADITWFTPSAMNKEGWTFPFGHIRYSTAVIYAQTFVYAPEDMQVLVNAGFSGALKVWVNDMPVIGEQKELLTELDLHKNYTTLKKGYNRLLVQLSYTNNSFPNFIIRFTDAQLNSIPGLQYSSDYQRYPVYTGDLKEAPPTIKHFAEAFFEDKLIQHPDNIINYILLCETYLRNKKTSEARTLIENVVKRFPDNSLLRLELMSCYVKESNNMLLLRETERMKEKDPGCMLAARLSIQKLMDTEKYTEAEEEIRRYDAQFGDEDAELLTSRVQLYSAQNQMNDLVHVIEDAYQKYPENITALQLMFNVKMQVDKDVNGALKVFEDYLVDNYNYEIMLRLSGEYKTQGKAEQQLNLLKSLAEKFPYDPEVITAVANHYYGKQDYKNAAEWARKALALAPYVSTYWENLGVELQQMQSEQEAASAFKKALYFNASNYTAREQLREIEQKPSVWKAFPETDVYQLIREDKNAIKGHNYYYLLDEQLGVLYAEGASEEYFTYVIKIANEKGIDDWKEMTIPYSSNSDYLIIEKAEAVKSNGEKTPAEQNENQLVFAGLEAGDAVVIKYKLQHSGWGRLGREYWNKFRFKGFVPELRSRVCYLVSKDLKFSYKTISSNAQPDISNYDDFTLYTWQMGGDDVIKEESYMPPAGDVSPSLFVSTIPSWSIIAAWYSDLSSEKMETDFEVNRTFKEIFPNGTKGMLQKNIAASIYNYICKNIRYSSVSFRQSAFTPQKPSVTINSGLGDCKDLATLFVTLGKMAGISSNLALVSTRDYGRQVMLLPAMEFNHCIVKSDLDGQPYFLELTDNSLPFASLPSSLYGAAMLVVPGKGGDTTGARLEYLNTPNQIVEKISRKVAVKVDHNDIKVQINVTKAGALSASLRDSYASLSDEDRIKKMQESISTSYKNAVNVNSLNFKGLDSLGSTVSYICGYTVTDEVSELGDIQMIKPPFGDLVATMDNFSSTDRTYPIEYYRYEDADEYETIIEISAPAGAVFIEIPKDVSFSFKGSTYSLAFLKKDQQHLIITRKAHVKRADIAPEDYAAMKQFLSNIVKAEGKFIAFKPL